VTGERLRSKSQASTGLAPRAIYFNERAAFVPQNTGKSNKQWAAGGGWLAMGSAQLKADSRKPFE
jgi:hypothetical protein